MSTYVWHSIRGCVCRPVKVSALVVQSGGLHIKFECKFEIFREPLTLEHMTSLARAYEDRQQLAMELFLLSSAFTCLLGLVAIVVSHALLFNSVFRFAAF